MSRDGKKVLKEACEREHEILRRLEPENPEYQNAIDRLAKLNKMMNDERQSETDCATKIVTCLGGLAVSVGGLYMTQRLAYDVLKFEKDDSISTFTGRSIIGNWLKFKVR